ncbi:MAG TPA: hypothetical protein VF178_00035 [Gemmatimonadaceae bacterium]
MQEGRDFLRAQVNNAIMMHRTMLDNIESHAKQAEDRRFAELCQRHLPRLQEHQQMLEQYGQAIGAEGKKGLKKAMGAALGVARDAADAMRESDFLRIVGDVVQMRQAQDTFGTFAAVGDQIGEPQLAEIGRQGERDHEQMQREFNQLTHQLFIDQYGGAAMAGAGAGAGVTGRH